MRKRRNFRKHRISLFLAVAVLMSGMPVYGQEAFSADWEEDVEFTAGDSSEFISSAEEVSERQGAEEIFGTEPLESNLHYVKGRPLTEEERLEELAPFDTLLDLGDAPEVGSNLDAVPYALYPERYDARTQGLITEVKNQHPFNICWAFGMASLLETSFLAENKGTVDLSEEHLAYFFSNRENDPLNHTAGDYNVNMQGYHEGGNDYLASIFLTTWSGMTTEKSVPLPTDTSHTEDNSMPLPASKAYETAAYLTDASFSDYSVDRMKQMITQDKSVAIMYYMNSAYYNPETGGYAYPKAEDGVNHVVTVVGWDDNYAKENFPEKSGVSQDGAWIVKNSWGAKWGENGYFYLSYEDKTIRSLISAHATDQPKYENNYFYDGSSALKTISLKPKQSMANVFTAKAKKGYTEAIGEINAITYSDNAQYTVQIYTDLKDLSDPTSGKKAYEKPVSVSQALAGIKTVNVPEVKVAYGTSYGVVLTNVGNNNIKLCVEASGEHSGWFSGHAQISKGQGFFGSTTGKWTDLISLSATPRIKVHTRTAEPVKAPVLTAIPRSYNKIALLWDEVSGASGYILYRSEPGKKKTKLAEVSGNELSYPDRKVKTGVKYTYTIQPYAKIDGKTVKGAESEAVTAAARLEVPVFQVKASEDKYNTVSWNKISGALEYQIYRKAPGGKLRRIATVNSSVQKYKDKNIEYGESYIYMVRAKRGTALSKYTTSEIIKAVPAPQSVDALSNTSKGIRIRWHENKKCDGYKIYRKTKSGSWSLIKTISSETISSYIDKKASKGVLYYYAVKAYVKEPYGILCGDQKNSRAITRK